MPGQCAQTKRRRRMLAGAEAESGIKHDNRLIFARSFLLQLGLMSKASPISMGLKCRFHDSAQSSRRTFASVTLPEPIFSPHW